MKHEPTKKQVKFAEVISAALELPIPEERTRQSLFLFIRDNKAKYDAMQEECFDPDYDCYMADAMGIDLATGCLGD